MLQHSTSCEVLLDLKYTYSEIGKLGAFGNEISVSNGEDSKCTFAKGMGREEVRVC